MGTDGQQKQRLSERLKQRQALELAEVEQSTRLELERLNGTLTQLVNDELTTTKAAISGQTQAINLLLQKQSNALNAHGQTLEGMKGLTLSETQTIRQDLTEALRQMQSETIESALAPLKASLQQVQKDGEALSLMTTKAWLKPLLISLAITVGLGLGAFGIAGTMGLIYAKKINEISRINQEIDQAKQTLIALPKGITFVEEKGKKYILAKQIDTPLKLEKGEFKGLMVVEIK